MGLSWTYHLGLTLHLHLHFARPANVIMLCCLWQKMLNVLLIGKWCVGSKVVHLQSLIRYIQIEKESFAFCIIKEKLPLKTWCQKFFSRYWILNWAMQYSAPHPGLVMVVEEVKLTLSLTCVISSCLVDLFLNLLFFPLRKN